MKNEVTGAVRSTATLTPYILLLGIVVLLLNLLNIIWNIEHTSSKEVPLESTTEYKMGYSQALYDVAKHVDQDTTLTADGKISILDFLLGSYPKIDTLKK